MRHLRSVPSPTALRSPLSPREREEEFFEDFALSLGERGNRKAVGEGSYSNPWDINGILVKL